MKRLSASVRKRRSLRRRNAKLGRRKVEQRVKKRRNNIRKVGERISNKRKMAAFMEQMRQRAEAASRKATEARKKAEAEANSE